MQVNNLGACGGGTGAGGGTGGGSSGGYPFSPDIARKTRVPHELPAQVQLQRGNFNGSNCP